MKNLYCSLSLCFFSVLTFGQIVNIPDANFKNRLVTTDCASLVGGSAPMDVDTNNNGEIEISEAVAIQRLNLQNYAISSVEGIQYFTNLNELLLNDNQITTLNISNLIFLSRLKCNNNQLTSLAIGENMLSLYLSGNELSNLDFLVNNPALIFLDISGNNISNFSPLSNAPNLQSIDVSYSGLTTLNLSSTNLLSIDCSGNQLTTLYATDLPPNIDRLYCIDNQLTSLTLPNSITVLFCDNNQLTELDISDLNLQSLSVEYNQLTNLDISATSDFTEGILGISGNLYTAINLPPHKIGRFLCQNTNLISLELMPDNPYDAEQYIINNNANLRFLNLRNGGMDFCTPDPFDWCFFTLTNNAALEYICLDDDEIEDTALLEIIANANNPNVQFSSYCSFSPGGDFNTLTGNIRFDMDSNGCNIGDNAAPFIPIRINRNGFNLGTTFTNINGDYIAYESYSNLTLTPLFNNPYFTITPASYTSNFIGLGNTETANFCIAPNGVHNDLEAGLIPITPARPGFDATYKIVFKNKGTTTQSGTVTFNFSDFYSDFVSASVVPNTQSGDLVSWTYTNLAPFETREITVVLNVNSPVETPAVNPGDLLTLGVQVSPSATDETYLDNYANLTQVVVGSFDPNDKQVSDLTYYYELAETKDLYYTIRFQNLGTFLAENVVVADVISTNLDANKLQMVAASHPYVSRYNAATRKLEFIFEGINLPAAIDNEPGSHGYVSFKIKPISTITLGQTLENKADIYFDFNAPVATNTTSTIIETLLKTDGFSNTAFILHPNPVKNTVNVDVASGVIIESIAIYNPLGQLVKTLAASELSSSLTIDVSALKTGTYFLEIESNNGKTTKKFIKL